MGRQIGTILIAALVMLSSILPGHARAAQPAQTPADVWLQGEIAYVRDGDIWLLDLTSGGSQQLTTDGDNRWPAWSADGGTLLYTHATGPEDFDLYILEVGRGEPRLLVAHACCAAGEPDGERIAFISLADGELALETVRADASDRRQELAPLAYGRGVWPTGNLLWDESGLYIPLDVIAGSAQTSLVTFTDLFRLDGGDLAPLFNAGEQDGCNWSGLNRVPMGEPVVRERSAVAFSGPSGCDAGLPLTADPGQSVLVWDEPSAFARQLAGLAHPSLSPDGRHLAAERRGDASAAPDLILYNTANDFEFTLVEGAAQPAWRPTAPVDPTAARYARPGERVFTIDPPLRYQGADYRVHYYATGDYRSPSPRLFAVATPDFFASQGITALVVTRDGQVVRDAETLRRVFTLYTAAYHLYTGSPEVPIPEYAEELGKIIGNPLLLAFEPEQLFASRRDQTAEVLAGLLTDQLSAQAKTQALFEQLSQEDPKRLEDALKVLDAIAEDSAAQDALTGALSADLAQLYADLDTRVAWSGRGLKLMRLATQLLTVNHLQRERADWLAAYLDAFPSGDGSFDRDQIRAAATALDEVESAFTQRVNIALDFVADEATEALLDLGGEAARQATAQLMAKVGEKYGLQISTHAVASALSAVSIGLTVNGILYGTDALYDNFALAQRAEELRHTFRAGRLALQTQAAADAPVYDGDLAERFRAAYLLEALAALGSQRAYAEGVAATTRLPNPLDLLNWLRGQDWEAAVRGLHALADQTEQKVMEAVGSPAYLDAALSLALSRIQPQVEEIIGTPEEPGFPKLHPEWTSYTNGNFVTDLLVTEDYIWAATSGGVVRWDTQTAQYMKLTTADGLADNDVQSMLQDGEGGLWFSTYGGGVSHLDAGGRWSTFTTADGLAHNVVLSMQQDGEGGLWFGTYDGLSRLDAGGRWTTFTTDDGLAGNYVGSMLQDGAGSLWFGTGGGGVSRLDADGRWTTFTSADGLADNSVRSILQDGEGSLWFGTYDGVSRLDATGHWTTFTIAYGLPGDNSIQSILQDGEGSLWFGTYDGVSRLDADGRWTTFTTDDGLADNGVLSILQDGEGNLWFGTWGGVSRLDAGGRWTTFTTDDGLADNDVVAILQDEAGSLWFATRGGGVSHLDAAGRWTTFTSADGLAHNYVLSILQDGAGSLLFATLGGVSRLDADGRWSAFTTADGLAANGVFSILQDGEGNLWFGTWGGVSRYRPLDE